MHAGLSDDELIAVTCPIIQAAGSSFYFTPATTAQGEALGLDRSQFYFMGRGGVLGDVEPAVVTSAFGYFNPAVVAVMWNAGKAKVAPRVAGALYMECAAEHGRAKLAGVAGLDAFNAAAEKVVEAADVDALTLFAAVAAEPRAADGPGRAMQLVTVLREFRGSAHLVAVRANGLTSKEAHYVSRPEAARMFGWAEGDAPHIDDQHRAAMAEAEALTDRLVRPAYAALSQDERAALVAGLQSIQAALAA